MFQASSPGCSSLTFYKAGKVKLGRGIWLTPLCSRLSYPSSVLAQSVPPFPPQPTSGCGSKASVSIFVGSNVEFHGERAYIAKATNPLPHSHRDKPKHRIPTPTPRTNPSSPPGINWTHRSIKHFRRGQRVCLQKYFKIVLGGQESELTGWGEVNKQTIRDYF